jgi:hypothetical protein
MAILFIKENHKMKFCKNTDCDNILRGKRINIPFIKSEINKKVTWLPVVHECNPSYLGD